MAQAKTIREEIQEISFSASGMIQLISKSRRFCARSLVI